MFLREKLLVIFVSGLAMPQIALAQVAPGLRLHPQAAVGARRVTSASVPSTPTSPSPGSTSSPGPTLSSSTVFLSWGTSSGATYYDLGVRDLSTNQLVVDTQTTSSSYTAFLSSGRPYRWNLAACNTSGCSSYTTPRYFQTPGSVPSTPSNPSPGSTSSPGPTLSSSTVALSWGTSSGATYYDLGVRDLGTNQLVVDTQTGSPSYTANLSSGRPYRWNVAACNSSGCSSFTTDRYFQTPGSVPSTPSNPSPGSTSSPGPTLSSSTVALSWGTSSGATYYDLGVRDLSTNQLVVDTQTGSPSYTANLSSGRPYRWNVAACSSSGCSSFTTDRYFQTPGSVPSIPSNPSPGSTSSPGPTLSSTTVTITWGSSNGATYYDLGVRDMTSGLFAVNTQPGTNSYTATLSSGTPYKWNVAACNSTGCSSYTTPLYFQTPGSKPPTPTSPSPGSTSSPGPTLSSTTVTITWGSSNGATYYDLGVRDMTTGLFAVNTQPGTNSYTATLSSGTPYKWNVAACNSTGCSSYTTPLYFQTPGSKPPTPTSPSPGSTSSPGPTLSSTTVTITWGSSNGATYYDLGVRDMTTGLFAVNTQPGTNSYTATLSSGTPYKWDVAACNSAGCSGRTIDLYFQTPGSKPPTPTSPSPGSTSSPGPTLSSTTVTITWGSSNGATYYDLGVRDMTTGLFAVNAQPGTNSYAATGACQPR